MLVEPSILQQITDGRIPELPKVTAFSPDEQTVIGDVLITGVGGQHAVIHRDIPRIGNVGVLLRAEGERQFRALCDSRIGAVEEVLMERGGLGRTAQFVPVAVAGAQPGELLDVRIVATSGKGLVGEMLQAAA